jgi:quercetin dioxygenase-like cupin family protein
MIVKKIDEMFRGWFIGDFEPSIHRTKEFEVGYLLHKKGEVWKAHYHAVGTEVNYLIRGKMILRNVEFENKMQDLELNTGDLFVLYSNEIADPIFLEDCEFIVVKFPSLPGDKHFVN